MWQFEMMSVERVDGPEEGEYDVESESESKGKCEGNRLGAGEVEGE